MKNTSKKLNRILLLVLAVAMVLGVCLALAACKPEEQTGPSDPVLYWNVEGKEYRSGKFTRMASSEDGYVYMLFAKDGEQFRIPVADTLLANKIDMMDCMGLVMDENGVVVDAVRVEDFTGGYAANNYVVESIEGTKVTANSSGLLDGHQITIDVPEGTPVWNISGTGITVGIPWTLGVDDKIIAINDTDGKLMCVYTEAYTPPQDIYWNVNRMYDSASKMSTRMSEAGGYRITLACNGEQKEYRTKESNVVQQMDAMAARCFALEFDEEGYIIGVTHGGTAAGGGSAASWYHCISIDGQNVEFERLASGSNVGAKYTGMISKNMKVFNVSSTAEVVGEVTELREGDQVHCLLDSRGRLAVVFVVSRRVESEIYWNIERKWDSKAKQTTRRPAADGWYYIDVAVRGKQITVKTQEWAIANSIDGRAAKCFGLKLDENNVIQKFYTPDAAKGATFASWYDITALDGANIELIKAGSGDVKKGIVGPGCEIYNVSSTATMVGEVTTLQVGDRVHTLKDLDGSINVAYVVNRYVDWPIYYNLDRKYNSTTKETTRKPDADGYYVFRMAVNGEEVTLKTKSKNVANAIDKEAAKCLTMSVDHNGIIYKAMHASNAMVCKGAASSSWTTVTSISKTGFTTHKSTGVDYDETYAWNAKVYNVSANFIDHQGEETKLQVGDFVHCLTNRRGEVTYVYVMTRFLEADVYYNLDRKWDGSKSTRTPDADGVYSFQMAFGGEEVTVKTTDPEVVHNIDKEVAKCVGLLFDENGYCTFATHAQNTEYCRGGIGMSYANVTKVEGNQVTVSKDGALTTFTISDDCEMFVTLETEGLTRGNYTTVREGDYVHCLKAADGNTNYMAIMSRVKQMPKTEHTCQHVTEDVTWYEFDGSGFPMDGHYVLTDNITMDARVTVNAGVEVTLCLNGHTITSTDRVFNTYGTINICDHKGADGKYAGKITSSFGGSSYGGISYIYNDKGNASFNIYGGTLEHTGTLNNGGLFYVGNKTGSGYLAVLNIYDGTLTGGKTTGAGGGIQISNGCQVNMYGGTITGCTVTGSYAGGAVRADNGTFNMTGGVIEGNKAYEGGNVSVGTSGTVNISDKAIVRNGNATNGANFQVIGKLNITDGATVTGGTVTSQGTAISAYANAATAHAIIHVENVTIDGSIRLDTGKGPVEMTVIDAKVTDQLKVGTNNCTLTVGGKVELAEVRLLDGKVIAIHENGLDDTSSIAVTMDNPDKPFATITDANDEGCFEPADPAIYKLVNDNNDLYLESTVKPHKHCACDGEAAGKPNHTCSTVEYLPWTDATSLPTSGKYYLTTDVSVTKTFEIRAELDLCLNGHKIEGTTRIYKVYSTFNLGDCAAKNSDGSCKGKLIGNQTSTTLGPTFYIYAGSTFNLFGGEITVSSTSKTTQAGVGGIQEGTFNMYGGKICGGNVTGKGGCLCIFDKANVNLYAGEISGGKAVGAGGNIYLSKGTLTIYDGFTVSGGYTEATGGNIFCDTSADNHLLIMGGLITGGKTVATADKSGGNLDIRCADAKILGGIVEKGYAYEGGNIRVGNNGNLIIGGNAIVRDGEAKASGGNIALFKTLTIQDDAVISGGNAVGGDGGNISAFANTSTASAKLTITGGKITGGTAKGKGGSIRLSGKDGTVDVAFLGGTIEKGSAGSYTCVFVGNVAGVHVTVGGDAKIYSLGLEGSKQISVSTDKPLTTGAKIGVYRSTDGVIAEDVATDVTEFIHSTTTGKSLTYDPDAKTLTQG